VQQRSEVFHLCTTYQSNIDIFYTSTYILIRYIQHQVPEDISISTDKIEVTRYRVALEKESATCAWAWQTKARQVLLTRSMKAVKIDPTVEG
jgi:hypothetical protein